MQNFAPWPTDKTDALRALWVTSLSASQIAYELGFPYTRNAVIGKAHRIGLPPRNRRGQRHPKPVVHVLPRVPRSNGAKRMFDECNVTRLFTAPIEEVTDPLRVTINDLRERMCKWPLGDPLNDDFAFCGLRCETGASYCEGHRTLAYLPVVKAKKAA